MLITAVAVASLTPLPPLLPPAKYKVRIQRRLISREYKEILSGIPFSETDVVLVVVVAVIMFSTLDTRPKSVGEGTS